MSDKTEGRRTPLYDLHVSAGARMVDFGGWEMPVQYGGIISEHTAVREAAGAFDVSHMGRLMVSGADAEAFLQYAGTNDVTRLEDGQAQYSLLCNRDGGVRDDVLIYRLSETEYLVVVNASNREKILSWFDELGQELSGSAGGPRNVAITDRTIETVMIGVQGPKAVEMMDPLTQGAAGQLGYYRARPVTLFGGEGLISRTGYTGEDGFEVILDIDPGRRLWQHLKELAGDGALALAGLGARDTLRLEAGLPLYGNELDETINPIEAGLSRLVKLSKGGFVGRDALSGIAASGASRRLIGLIVEDGAIARQGSRVEARGVDAGEVTSGSFAPTVGGSISMALLNSGVAGDAGLQVVVRGQPHACRVVDLPFLERRKRKQT
jgi:aminomethyltransferase